VYDNEFIFRHGSTGFFELFIEPIPEELFILQWIYLNERNVSKQEKENG
jgi:hypothetical protein